MRTRVLVWNALVASVDDLTPESAERADEEQRADDEALHGDERAGHPEDETRTPRGTGSSGKEAR